MCSKQHGFTCIVNRCETGVPEGIAKYFKAPGCVCDGCSATVDVCPHVMIVIATVGASEQNMSMKEAGQQHV